VSAVAGVVYFDGSAEPGTHIGGMIDSLAHRGGASRGVWSDGVAAVGHRGRRITHESRYESQPEVHTAAPLVLVADARIDNREELAAALGLSEVARRGDAEVLLAAYERWGTECVRRIDGDFVFAVWNRAARSLFLARDRMGVKPLYYVRTARFFAFASEIKALFTLPGVSDEIDPQMVGLFLVGDPGGRERTMYRSIRRVPAASLMRIDAQATTIATYWALVDAPDVRYARDDEYVADFRNRFENAVRCRMRSAGAVGATLSGGLDSSAVTCVARDVARREGRAPVQTFSLIFPDLPARDLRSIDEREFIDAVVREGGIDAHFVRGDRLSPMTELSSALWHLDEPFFAPNLYLHRGMYAAAEDAGVHVLLDGFDGDSAVGHGFGRLNGLLHAGQWDAFEAEVRGFASHRGSSPGAVLPHYGLPWLGELARKGRLVAWGRAAREIVRRFGVSRREILGTYGLRTMLRRGGDLRDWSEGEGLLRAELRPVLNEWRRAEMLETRRDLPRGDREVHLEGISQPGYQLTLELADRSAAAFGIEPRYPFFDRKLMELCVAVPDEQKLSQGWSRWIQRRAMEGVLPPEIQWRGTKGNLSPNFFRGFRSLDAAVVDRIDLAASAGYLDLDELRTRLQTDRERSASERSPATFVLFRALVLAAWLERREHASRKSASASRADAHVGAPTAHLAAS
jgi:asparagine synthase (glutamine-hydrolysing)